ncbi:endonuclease-reverse transcriptase [Plakobranchus ocellatus]|uniref:Endonuclease-reverse transcriptase n=1 Tax=Plakobranchus ocellatus TaxID=259542 RepID=A0AAV3XQ67_9GAST|nr:endonuclease-reverse transcriptase [Plakobranchus ocellatus]
MKSDNSVKGVSSSAGNSSLGREDHVRQVSPDRHQATVRNRQQLKIGTWNVRTFRRVKRFKKVMQEMEMMKLNILGISEMRWKKNGECDTKDGYKILWSGGEQHHRGVGVILDPETSEAFMDFWPVSDRVIVVKLHCKPFDIGLIQVYAPTAKSKYDEEVEIFYETVKIAMKKLKSQDFKIVMGDVNAKVGSERTENIVGPFGIGEKNKRGDRLIKFCKEHNLTVMNTWCENDPERRWTWKSPGDRYRNMIDFILIQEPFRDSITSCKSMTEADCGSDHVPVVGTMELELELERIKRAETAQKLSRMLESAKEHIPVTTRKEDKTWMTQKILDLMEENKKAKADKQKYRELDKQVKKRYIEAKEYWIKTQCEEIEANTEIDSKTMDKKIKEVTGEKVSAKSRDGGTFMEKEDILKSWSEYITELYQDDRGPPPNISNEHEGPSILEKEVQMALKKMKKGAAAGPDDIPPEMLTALDEFGIKEVTKLLNVIYAKGKIPTDLKKSVYIAKVMLLVLINRVRTKILPEISETQFGFRADKDTRNAIFALRILMERTIEVQKDLYLCFIDYSSAFDKVRHSDLFDTFLRQNCDDKDLRVIRNLYEEQEAAMRVDNDCSERIPICRGVRQSCVFSSDLFNICSEMILRNIEQHEGVKVGGININNLRYANDIVLIADSEEKLKGILTTVTIESENKGLQLNAEKIECMVISKQSDVPECNISCKEGRIKQVRTFKYLGFTITPDARCDTEIQRIIALSKDTFIKMKSIFADRDISLSTKIRTMKVYIRSILLYGCECWTLTKDLEKRLEAAEMWCVSRIMRTSWTKSISNEEEMEMDGYKRSLLKTIRERQLQFWEHINSADGIETQILYGEIYGTRSRGKPRQKYTDILKR